MILNKLSKEKTVIPRTLYVENTDSREGSIDLQAGVFSRLNHSPKRQFIREDKENFVFLL